MAELITSTKFKINFEENVTFYEIESDDSYEDPTDEEVIAELDKANDEYMENVVEPRLLAHIAPCMCQMDRIVKRGMRRAAITNAQGQNINVSLEQEDVDNYKFGVIAYTERGKLNDIELIIRSCKDCGKIEMFGKIEALTRLFAESITNFHTYTEREKMSNENKKEDPLAELFGEGYELENIDDPEEEIVAEYTEPAE